MGALNEVLSLAKSQVGYLEKASPENLDSRTANAGYQNYTKYSRDVDSWGLMGCQGQPWCATYQFWLQTQVFGKNRALEHMGQGFYNCASVTNHAKAMGTWHSTPKAGALVVFRDGAHIGLVIRVTSTRIYTNEGNTSAGGENEVEANGGCVAEKSYTRAYPGIDGYVWIDYGEKPPAHSQPESGNPGQPSPEEGQDRTRRIFTGQVTASRLSVRTWAGTEYPEILSCPELPRGRVVEVMDYTQKDTHGADWYFIKIRREGKESVYGFVHSRYIKRL